MWVQSVDCRGNIYLICFKKTRKSRYLNLDAVLVLDATIMKHVNEFLESVEGCREIA